MRVRECARARAFARLRGRQEGLRAYFPARSELVWAAHSEPTSTAHGSIESASGPLVRSPPLLRMAPSRAPLRRSSRGARLKQRPPGGAGLPQQASRGPASAGGETSAALTVGVTRRSRRHADQRRLGAAPRVAGRLRRGSCPEFRFKASQRSCPMRVPRRSQSRRRRVCVCVHVCVCAFPAEVKAGTPGQGSRHKG